jgi:hypothetical protein
MLPEKRPPHVAQSSENNGQKAPRVPIYPICERIYRDAVRLVGHGEVRNLVPLLAMRNHLSEQQVTIILITTSISYERTATNWQVGMRNVEQMAREAAASVWEEARTA